MFQRTLLRFTSATEVSSLLQSVEDIVRKSPSSSNGIPLATLSRSLDDDQIELISEEHGGVLAFVRKHGTTRGLEVKSQVMKDGRKMWLVGAKPSSSELNWIPPVPTVVSQPTHSIPRSVLKADPALEPFPSYLVPLSALKYAAQLDSKRPADASSLAKSLVGSRRKLDVVSPTMSPDTVVSLLDSAAVEGEEGTRNMDLVVGLVSEALDENSSCELFVRISPPFASSGSRITDTTLESYRAEEYDAFRLARHLSTQQPLPLQSLKTVQESHLSKSLHHVILSFPELFAFNESKQEVTFVLPPQFEVPPLPSSEQDIENQIQDNKAHLKELKKQKKLVTKIIRKYSALPRLLKRWRHRHSIFQHPEVLAYHIFDVLPHDRHIFIDDLHLLMEEEARYGLTIDVKFFKKRPHLFHYFRVNNDWRTAFQRADIPRPDDREVTVEDIMPSVLEVTTTIWESTSQIRTQSECDAGTIASRLRPAVLKLIKEQYGTLDNFLVKHPQQFRVVEGKSSVAHSPGATLVVSDAQSGISI